MYSHGGFSFAPGVASFESSSGARAVPAAEVSVVVAAFAMEQYLDAESSSSANSRTGATGSGVIKSPIKIRPDCFFFFSFFSLSTFFCRDGNVHNGNKKNGN